MTDDQRIALLEKYEHYLQIADTLGSAVRKLGWWIVKGLIWLVDSLSNIFYSSFEMLGFYNDNKISGASGSVIDMLKPMQSYFLLIALLITGFVLYKGKSNEAKEVPMNIMLMMMILMMLPSLMNDSLNLVKGTFQTFQSDTKSPGFTIFKENVTDVYVIGQSGWTSTITPGSDMVGPVKPGQDRGDHNYLTNLKFFDINEKIEEAGAVDNGTKLLDYKLVNKVGGTGTELKKLKQGDGLLDSLIKAIVGEYYYRWSWNFWFIVVSLFAMAVAYIISLLRVGRLGIEIAFNKVYASVIGFIDVRSLQRFKTAVMDIFGAFAAVIGIIVMYFMFQLYTGAIANSSINPIGQILMLLGGMWFVYDGPTIIQKTLGIDAGLSSSLGAIGGLYGAGKAAKFASSAIEKTANAGAGAGGFVAGLMGGSDDDTGAGGDKNDDKNSGINDDVDDTDNSGNQENNQETDTDKNDTSNEDSKEGKSESDGESGTDGEADKGINGQIDSDEGSDSGDDNTEDTDSSDNEDKGINDDVDNQESTSNEGTSTEEDSKPDTEEPKNTQEDKNEPVEKEDGSKEKQEDKTKIPQEPKNDESSKEEGEGVNKESNSKNEKSDKSKELEKPKNPIVNKVKENMNTPNYQKNAKGKVANAIDHGKGGQQLGKDWKKYMSDKKAYKAQEKSKKDKNE